MQVALIPPRGLEQFTQRTQFQMALPHLFYDEYKDTYELADRRGNYTILDNGAAESLGLLRASRLCVLARRVFAKELVAHDILGDAKNTIVATSAFFVELAQMPQHYTEGLNFMAVAQGTSIDDAMRCVDAFAHNEQITAIGIPRLLLTPLHKAIRIDVANRIERTYPGRFKIHLLGASTLWPQEVRAAARYAPHIRSIDTSMPFVLAMAGIRLDAATLPHEVKRPDNYFAERRREAPPMSLYEANVQTLLEWASYVEKAPTS